VDGCGRMRHRNDVVGYSLCGWVRGIGLVAFNGWCAGLFVFFVFCAAVLAMAVAVLGVVLYIAVLFVSGLGY